MDINSLTELINNFSPMMGKEYNVEQAERRAAAETAACKQIFKGNGEKWNKQGPIPAQKSRGNSVLGVVFSHTMPRIYFQYFHRFIWEETH